VCFQGKDESKGASKQYRSLRRPCVHLSGLYCAVHPTRRKQEIFMQSWAFVSFGPSQKKGKMTHPRFSLILRTPSQEGSGAIAPQT